MSLENAINEHAAAIRELAAAILASARTPAAAPVGNLAAPDKAKTEVKGTAKAEAAANQEKVEAERKEAAQAAIKQALADAEAKKKEQTDDLSGSGEAAPVLDYSKDVEHKFKAFLKEKGREAGLALLKKYGAASGSQVAQGKLAAFLADIEAA